MNARPVRDAATSIASRGSSPRRRSSTKRSRISDVNSVHAATTSGPPTAVIGLSLRLNAYANERRDADRDQHRARATAATRMTQRSRTARNRKTNRIAR